MGGRGAFLSSGFTGIPSKTYYQVVKIGDIRVIAKNDGSASFSLPVRSNTPNRVYAILDEKGKPKQIGMYEDHIITTTIDFGHGHDPNIHANDWVIRDTDQNGPVSKRNNGKRYTFSPSEQKLIDSLVKFYGR